MKSDNEQGFWFGYYKNFIGKDIHWLDYSNERVQSQSFALALEAAGPIHNRRCLDVGCGNGQIALSLKALQASQVTGIDFIEEFIQKNRKENPDIHWQCGDVTDQQFCSSLGIFDVIFMLEILQCLPAQESVIKALWDQLAPNGRVIAMVPNLYCPIASKTIDKLKGNYFPVDPQRLVELFHSLPDLGYWSMRGLHFQQEQQLLPYFASPWTTSPKWPEPPNRILFVLQKNE